ncbi:hypothetical protein E4T48_00633 [Aureobasidium sp. EXF-10727]|nr:hypothetical protein E4T48_00633 [Aureobasidium sp. EXF-10727]
MSSSSPKDSKPSITPETIALHLNSEPNLPGAEDLDVDLVLKWLIALNLNFRNKELKRLAPKVLEELRAMDGITAEEVARHQQRYPVKRETPVLVHAWGGNGEVSDVKKEISSPKQQRSAFEVVGKKKHKKHGIDADDQASLDAKDNNEASNVKLEDFSDKEDAKQTAAETVDTAAAKKKAKKAAKRARKLAQALEEAKPPVGKKEEDNDSDGGNGSDWTQTSWSPSWATDSEEDD